ncbi:MAG: peptidoglycan-binding protein, partial [Gammaproteobacteria bacterium]|nr:peptidoglycan-binding protein [Gammaproteobacteria bacterium]
PNAPGEQSGDNRSSPAAIEIAVQSEPQPSVQPVALETLLMDRREGLRQLLARWGIVPEENYRGADLCDWALQQGVRCRESNGGWKQIQQYDRPAMIELTGRPKQRYALVTGIGPRYATLTQGDRSSRILREELDAHWRGSFLLLWRPPPDGVTLIGPGANQNYAAWLQQRLAHIPGFAVSFHPPASYDRQLQDAIRRFQQQQGLQTDGLVGPETIIALNSQASVADTPRLEQTE